MSIRVPKEVDALIDAPLKEMGSIVNMVHVYSMGRGAHRSYIPALQEPV